MKKFRGPQLIDKIFFNIFQEYQRKTKDQQQTFFRDRCWRPLLEFNLYQKLIACNRETKGGGVAIYIQKKY